MSGFRFDLFLSLIRGIFPRWDFFDRIAYHFELEVQKADGADWERVSFEQSLKPRGLFLNTDANEAMAQMNVIEHFAQDIQGQEAANDLSQMTSYRLIRELVLLKAPSDFSTMKFRVIAVNPETRLILYTSDWIKRGAHESL